MKKSLLLASLPLMLFSSCLDDVKDTTESMDYQCAVLINSDDAAQQPVISAFRPALSYNYTKQTVKVSVSALPVFGGTLSFETEPMTYTYNYFYYGIAQSFSESRTQASGIANSITDFTASLTSNVATPYKIEIPELGVADFGYSGTALIMSMKAGEHYSLNTIPLLAYYIGVTTAEYTNSESGENISFANEKVGYRIAIDPSSKKATLAIQNLRLKESDEATSLFFPDLALTPKQGAYEITGSNLKPMIFDGIKYAEQSEIIYPELSITTTDVKLTEIVLNLTVPSSEKITFAGSYLMPK